MRLEKLRNLMKESGITWYVIPTDDFHASEYVGDFFQAREYISGFTGSAGTLLVGMEFAGLWTDGRYFLQAADQLAGSGITLMKMGVEGVPTLPDYLAAHFTENDTLGFDGRCLSAGFMEECKDAMGEKPLRVVYDRDLVGEIWTDRPALSKKPAWFLKDEQCGASFEEKLADVREKMKARGAESLLLTSLDDIAWLLNMRGDDIAYNPVVLAFCVVSASEVHLFIQRGSLNAEQEIRLVKAGVYLEDYLSVYEFVKNLTVKSIWLNDQKTSYALMENIPAAVRKLKGMTPVAAAKCVKNATEQEAMRRAHLKDGVAMTKFMYWLKKNVGKVEMTEISAAEQLREFRAAFDSFVEESFTTICGYGAHGAIIHYHAVPETNAQIRPEGLLLVDSGGQYFEGTTDITRTFALGPVTDEEKRHFTTVLRSNLRLGSVVFKEGCTGENLDMVARQPLWEEGLDYNHGTGHGIGFVLNVHETPARISWKGRPGYGENAVFVPGMIVSNEPGVYPAGKHGIRLENLILCQEAQTNEYGRFLKFETLTIVPFDLDAVDVTLMDEKEKSLLNNYHARVYREISPYLTAEENEWLLEATRAV